MRTFKFNYWNGEEMKQADIIHVCDVGGVITSRAWDRDLHEYFDLIEFTGLLDAKGNEIYEGDILQYQREGSTKVHPNVGPVHFKNGRFWCGYNKTNYLGTPSFSKVFAVIGNEFENPNLLK